jgi:acetylornithine deacetylase/succinyl-diaminopimelate desuccinylase-like protein
MNSVLLAMLLAANDDRQLIDAQVTKHHTEAVERLRKWVALPSIAAEGLNTEQGVTAMMNLAREAGFQKVERVATDGKPGVFATLDAGAQKTLGLYFMYDVKQFDPKEWSSAPLAGKLVDKPGLGKVMVGRGAVNQKGPEAAFLAALHAIRAAGKKLPVNLVLIAEGEEEIGSPHFAQLVRKPEVAAALAKTVGVMMPSAEQGLQGDVTLTLGAKGVVELELVSTGEKWGRGPGKDVHSGNRARLDSPTFHLVQALATLVDANGNPAIDGFATKARPLTAEENESDDLQRLDAKVWASDAGWRESLANLVSKPTVNIEGIVAGYTGPGGKTVLPHRAVAKLDLRLVPDMTAEGAAAALKAHLVKCGFGDLEVNVTGGYDPNSTAVSSTLVQLAIATYKARGVETMLAPRSAGSWPGYVFTNAPLSLPAIHFGLGYGDGAHAPNEFYVIESTNPKISGFDDAIKSYVAFLYDLAR